MQRHARHQALDADAGGVGQAIPGPEAGQFGDQVLDADGRPGSSGKLAEHFNGCD